MDNSTASLIPLIHNTDQASFLKYASLFAENIKIPVISVCGYSTPKIVKNALKETKLKLYLLGVYLWENQIYLIVRKADDSHIKCIYCNSFDDKIITCQIEKKLINFNSQSKLK